MIDNNPKFDFPKNFLWGASTSAHQVEGGTHNQWTVWELENAQARSVNAEYKMGHHDNWSKIKDEAQDPNNYVSGKLADHYHRYKEDFDLLQKMNMNAYRFSIEWSRVEPIEGQWDESEIEHYRQYIDELVSRGIEPIMTLFHFTLPCWLVDKGGFVHRSNVKYFIRFVKKVMGEFESKVKYVITINEPDIYTFESYFNKNWPPSEHNFVKFFSVVNNLLYAHKKAFFAIKRINMDTKVSIAKSSVYFCADDGRFISRAARVIMQFIQDDYILMSVRKYCDFIGLNYYFSTVIEGLAVYDYQEHPSDLNWGMPPAEIQFILERLNKKYKLPIIITENGLADAADEHRKWWLTQTIMGMEKAVKNGVKLHGYLHWSLMDNFEWAYGKWPRFGLAAVNYKTGERKLRPSAVWFGSVIKKLRGL
ncbi:MAG: family 1 glycosylhydrolase [Candidatus Saccharibacteria bacterium]